MTSELRVDNLKGSTTGGSINVLGEGTSATTNLQQGLCKAWVNFNGASVDSNADLTGVRDSLNIASVVDNGTGDFSVTIANAFGNTSYVWSYGGKRASGDGTNCFDVNVKRDTDPTTTVTRHNVKDHDSSSDVDGEIVCMIFHGDLA